MAIKIELASKITLQSIRFGYNFIRHKKEIRNEKLFVYLNTNYIYIVNVVHIIN